MLTAFKMAFFFHHQRAHTEYGHKLKCFKIAILNMNFRCYKWAGQHLLIRISRRGVNCMNKFDHWMRFLKARYFSFFHHIWKLLLSTIKFWDDFWIALVITRKLAQMWIWSKKISKNDNFYEILHIKFEKFRLQSEFKRQLF